MCFSFARFTRESLMSLAVTSWPGNFQVCHWEKMNVLPIAIRASARKVWPVMRLVTGAFIHFPRGLIVRGARTWGGIRCNAPHGSRFPRMHAEQPQFYTCSPESIHLSEKSPRLLTRRD